MGDPELERRAWWEHEDLRRARGGSSLTASQLDQPALKGTIGNWVHTTSYLHSTRVNMKGREQRHFREQNEANTQTDQMSHCRKHLWAEEEAEGMSVLELGQSGEGGDRGYPLMESEVPRFLQPTSLPAEACVAHLCENQSRSLTL